MADREPDVIERMRRAHYAAHNDSVLEASKMEPGDAIRYCGSQAMLAAVVELGTHFKQQKDFATTAAIMRVLEEHERRSEGRSGDVTE